MSKHNSKNARLLLDSLIADRWGNVSETPPAYLAFELFACEQVLKRFNLSLDEITDGVVGGEGDGGIDGVFTFVGEQLVAEDADFFDDTSAVNGFSRNVPIALHLIQAKRADSFGERVFDLASSSLERLLDLEEPEEDLEELYSTDLVRRFSIFRKALHALAVRHPVVSVNFTYATKGDTASINSRVQKKAGDLEQQLTTVSTGAISTVQFMGAAELWTTADTNPNYTLQLNYQENATSDTSHIALVSLRDYMNFISDDQGELRHHIFDWNVRDYQGGVEVNREIQQSLLDAESPDSWWLNNGVTIIGSKISIQGKTFTLDDVQIVNGLQTSYATYLALKGAGSGEAVLDRQVLVRILETTDEKTRDRVIRATNRQTTISAASLRATDGVQRQIEAYFFANGWFYDRRKNYYRNAGKPLYRIVSIPFLAQAVMAIGLSRPDDARARPSSLLKSDTDYVNIFSDQTPLPVYLWAAKRQKNIDTFLQVPDVNASALERTNFRFHLAMLATAKLVGGRVYDPTQLARFTQEDLDFSKVDLEACLILLRELLQFQIAETNSSMDKIAKGRPFVEAIMSAYLDSVPQRNH